MQPSLLPFGQYRLPQPCPFVSLMVQPSLSAYRMTSSISLFGCRDLGAIAQSTIYISVNKRQQDPTSIVRFMTRLQPFVVHVTLGVLGEKENFLLTAFLL